MHHTHIHSYIHRYVNLRAWKDIFHLTQGDWVINHSSNSPHNSQMSSSRASNPTLHLTTEEIHIWKFGHKTQTLPSWPLHTGEFCFCNQKHYPLSHCLGSLLFTPRLLLWSWFPFIFVSFQVLKAEKPEAKKTRRTSDITNLSTLFTWASSPGLKRLQRRVIGKEES